MYIYPSLDDSCRENFINYRTIKKRLTGERPRTEGTRYSRGVSIARAPQQDRRRPVRARVEVGVTRARVRILYFYFVRVRFSFSSFFVVVVVIKYVVLFRVCRRRRCPGELPYSSTTNIMFGCGGGERPRFLADLYRRISRLKSQCGDKKKNARAPPPCDIKIIFFFSPNKYSILFIYYI